MNGNIRVLVQRIAALEAVSRLNVKAPYYQYNDSHPETVLSL